MDKDIKIDEDILAAEIEENIPEESKTPMGERAHNKLLEEEAITSPSKMAFRAFFHNKLGLIGLIGFIAIALIVFVGSMFLKYDPYYVQGVMKNISPGSGYMDIPSQMEQEGIKQVSVGTSFSIGVSDAGNVYTWGHDIAKKQPMPQEVIDNQGNIDQVAAGDNHVLVLTKDGEIYGWGENNFSQTVLPAQIKTLTDKEGIAKIGAADLYSVVLTKEGTVKVWGATMPTGLNMISSKYDGQVVDFATASTNMLVLLKDGSVVTFGQRGSEIDTAKPEELSEGGDAKAVLIGRMRYAAIAVTEEGENIVWGARADGAYNIPEIEGTIIKAATGREHITVLTDAGKVYSWGNNNYGATDYPTDDGYVDVFTGYFNNYGIKEDGSYTAWGLDGFIMGSDEQGRDLFTRLVHGGKMTLLIALVAVAIQVVLGVLIGVVSGFYGGWVDNVLMRFAEIISSFPFYPLIITLSALLPINVTQYQRLIMIMIILGVLNWPSIARLVRGEILSIREKDYITAAKALGLKEKDIMLSHMVPNIISIIIVRATIGYASSLLTEASLSFLGFGVQNPYPSWGNIMTASNNISVLQTYWWRWIFPGMAVFLTALTVNLIGDALRDAMDPKAQER